MALCISQFIHHLIVRHDTCTYLTSIFTVHSALYITCVYFLPHTSHETCTHYLCFFFTAKFTTPIHITRVYLLLIKPCMPCTHDMHALFTVHFTQQCSHYLCLLTSMHYAWQMCTLPVLIEQCKHNITPVDISMFIA